MSEQTESFQAIRCKRCSMEELASFEEIKLKISEYLETVDEDARISDEEYKARLELCFKCEGLIFGVTCKYCGCFVQMRALNRHRQCPNPSGNVWYVQRV